MQIVIDQSESVLKLAGSLEIGVAEELKKALLDFIGESATPIVDLAQVDACDTAALQLLCSARKTAESSGKSFEIAGLADAVCAAATALGLPLTEVAGKAGSIRAGQGGPNAI